MTKTLSQQGKAWGQEGMVVRPHILMGKTQRGNSRDELDGNPQSPTFKFLSDRFPFPEHSKMSRFLRPHLLRYLQSSGVHTLETQVLEWS